MQEGDRLSPRNKALVAVPEDALGVFAAVPVEVLRCVPGRDLAGEGYDGGGWAEVILYFLRLNLEVEFISQSHNRLITIFYKPNNFGINRSRADIMISMKTAFLTGHSDVDNNF